MDERAKHRDRSFAGGDLAALVRRRRLAGMERGHRAHRDLRTVHGRQHDFDEAIEPDLFVDEADFGDVVVRTIHHIERLEGGPSRVIYRMEISGPAADSVGPELGPQISADFPQTLAALAQHAER